MGPIHVRNYESLVLSTLYAGQVMTTTAKRAGAGRSNGSIVALMRWSACGDEIGRPTVWSVGRPAAVAVDELASRERPTICGPAIYRQQPRVPGEVAPRSRRQRAVTRSESSRSVRPTDRPSVRPAGKPPSREISVDSAGSGRPRLVGVVVTGSGRPAVRQT